MIVVDLGCHTHGDADSIHTLIARFGPRLLYGFDPHPENLERVYTIGTTCVVTTRQAAWTFDGHQALRIKGSSTRLDRRGATITETFDLATWLQTLPRVAIVLKLDVEGAEHQLLPHLHDAGADELLERILVEWHGEPGSVEMACPVEEWAI